MRQHRHRQPIDTDSPIGKAMFTIIGAMAELESSLISERVQAGMQTANEADSKRSRQQTKKKRTSDVHLCPTRRSKRSSAWQEKPTCRSARSRRPSRRPVRRMQGGRKSGCFRCRRQKKCAQRSKPAPMLTFYTYPESLPNTRWLHGVRYWRGRYWRGRYWRGQSPACRFPSTTS